MSEKIIVIDNTNSESIELKAVLAALKRNLLWIVLTAILFGLLGLVSFTTKTNAYKFRSTFISNIFKVDEYGPLFMDISELIEQSKFEKLSKNYNLNLEDISKVTFLQMNEVGTRNAVFEVSISTIQDSIGRDIIQKITTAVFEKPYFEKRIEEEKDRINAQIEIFETLYTSEEITPIEAKSIAREIASLKTELSNLAKFTPINEAFTRGDFQEANWLKYVITGILLGFFLSVSVIVSKELVK